MFFGGYNAGNGTARIYTVSGGVVSAVVATGALAYNAAHVYTVDFSVVGTNPSALTLIVSDVTAGTSVTVTASSSLSGAQVAGQSGMAILNGPGTISAFAEYTDTLSSLTSGVASVSAFGGGTASVTVANATGGAAPFSYQWYRSTTSGFTPGAGKLVFRSDKPDAERYGPYQRHYVLL